MIIMQYSGLLTIHNRCVSILNSNPFWGPYHNLAIPVAMLASAIIGIANLYGPGLQGVFSTAPIPSKFWGILFGFALGNLIMDEMQKLVVRSYPKVMHFLICNIIFCQIFFTHLLFIIVHHCKDGLVVLRISVYRISGELLFSSLSPVQYI